MTPDSSNSLVNPILETQIKSIDELFSRDPLKLSDQDLDKIVENLRLQRRKWKQEEAQGKTRASKMKPSASSQTTLTLSDFSLED